MSCPKVAHATADDHAFYIHSPSPNCNANARHRGVPLSAGSITTIGTRPGYGFWVRVAAAIVTTTVVA